MIFYFLVVMVLSCALLVVTMQNMVRAIFLFFVTLFCMSGLFVFALADFVAVTQLVVYVGGMLVLVVFAVLLSDKKLLDSGMNGKVKLIGLSVIPGIFISLLFFAILVVTIYQVAPQDLAWVNRGETYRLSPAENNLHHIGIHIMTRYLIPFEVVSVLLMCALIGAAHMARKERSI